MLVLILMNVHRRAVAGMREYLDDRIGTVRLRGRHTYQATLSRSRLQPLALVHRAGGVGVRCHCCCAFPSSCVRASCDVFTVSAPVYNAKSSTIRPAPFPAIALVVAGRKDHHHSRHWRLVAWSKRPLCLVADRRQTFEIIGNRAGVGFRQSGERAPRHDRSEDSPVWPNAGLDGRDNLIPAPGPQPGFVVRREVRTDECAPTGQFETDVGAAQKAR